MNSNIILTVAIPTYNGAATIAKTLESVSSQLIPGVEILISDNCSDDSTRQISQLFEDKYPAVKYKRQDTNIGYDRNVDYCMRSASGAFVWPLGDDDIILPGGVAAVLNAVTRNPEVGLLFVNYPHTIEVPVIDGGLCRSGDEFFRKTRFKSGFLSSNVFQKELWLKTNVAQYFDSGWIHMGFIVEVASSAASYVEPRALVDYIRDGTALMRWGGSGSFIHTGLKLVSIYSKMPGLGYSQITRRMAYLSVKGGYWKNICIAKAKGFTVSPGLIADFVRLYSDFPSFWLVDLPLLLCPGKIFQALFWIYKKLLSFK